MTEERCKHKTPQWNLSPANERGWTCGDCDKKMPGEPPGYRPDLDRSETKEKVGSVLLLLTTAELIYVSNSSQGDSMTATAARRCHETGLFDQYSIISFLLNLETDHGLYWKAIGEGVISGRDIRHRCWCGKLSNQSGANGSVCSLKHDVPLQGRVKIVRTRTRAGQPPLWEEDEEEEKTPAGLAELLAQPIIAAKES